MNVVAASTRIELSRIPRRRGWKKINTGMGKAAAKTLGGFLERTARPATVVSTGYCGALAGHLQANEVVVAESIEDGTGLRPLNSLLAERIASRLEREGLRCMRGTVTYRPDVVSTRDAKRALWATTHALAVDTESGPLAEAVSGHGGELVVVRVVLDSADQELPFSNTDSPVRSAFRHPAAARRMARSAWRTAATIGRAVELAQEEIEQGGRS